MAAITEATPAPPPALALPDTFELRRVLVSELRAASQAARDSVGDVERDRDGAVHAFRKALRRARAVLALVSCAVGPDEARAARKALRQARRALGDVRDHAVAPDTLAGLELDDALRAAASTVIAAASLALPAREDITRLLAEGAARAAAEVELVETALPTTLDWPVVLDGLRAVYRAARRARRDAKRSKRAFHTWRRRSKELSLQLQLLAGHGEQRIAELRDAVDALADAQREVVDLIMLRDLVHTYGDTLAPDVAEQLTDAIDEHLVPRMKQARRDGRDAFRRKPRELARRLNKRLAGDRAAVA